ncbi:MAG: hypothetical protein U0X73_11075 [Thermoanaerobaculia bacterium]
MIAKIRTIAFAAQILIVLGPVGAVDRQGPTSSTLLALAVRSPEGLVLAQAVFRSDAGENHSEDTLFVETPGGNLSIVSTMYERESGCYRDRFRDERTGWFADHRWCFRSKGLEAFPAPNDPGGIVALAQRADLEVLHQVSTSDGLKVSFVESKSRPLPQGDVAVALRQELVESDSSLSGTIAVPASVLDDLRFLNWLNTGQERKQWTILSKGVALVAELVRFSTGSRIPGVSQLDAAEIEESEPTSAEGSKAVSRFLEKFKGLGENGDQGPTRQPEKGIVEAPPGE